MVSPPTIYHLFMVATDGLVTRSASGPDNYFNELNIFHEEQTLVMTPGALQALCRCIPLPSHKPFLANVAQLYRVRVKVIKSCH